MNGLASGQSAKKRVKVGDIVTGMRGIGCGNCIHIAEANPSRALCGSTPAVSRNMLSQQGGVPLPKALSMADGALVEPRGRHARGHQIGDEAGDRVLGSAPSARRDLGAQLGAGQIVAACA